MSVMCRAAALSLPVLCGVTGEAMADRIRNPVAVFAGLDKITGRIISFEVAVDETVQFGSLQLTPKVCWTRPQNEQPQTTTFMEVDELGSDQKYRRVFTGWMYAASPGLHGIEHPVYDVWLTDCKGGTQRDLVVEPKEQDNVIPPGGSREARPRPAGQPQQSGPRQPQGGRIDVQPPQGVPTQPVQRPTQRFFPTNPGADFRDSRGGGG